MRLKIFSVNDTIQHAVKYKLYHRKDRNKDKEFEYIGLYKDKSVRYIGKVENIVYAELNNDVLEIIKSKYPLTQEQTYNIRECIKNRTDANISKGHKFFCVGEFIGTDFKKVSANGLQGTKVFNLLDYLEEKNFNDLSNIASILSCKTWE